MGVFSRFLRIWKADMHGIMDAIEDKELLLKHCLREMEEAHARSREEFARLQEERRRGAVEADRIRRQLDRIEADLDTAVAAGRDDACRALIKQRRRLLDQGDRHASALADHEAQLALVSERLEREEIALEELAARVGEDDRRRSTNPPSKERERFDTLLDRRRQQENLDLTVELELLQRKERLQRATPTPQTAL